MKLMIIMRGLPGSGKTTKSRHLRANFEKQGFTCQICSTDDFWYRNDKYDFNVSYLAFSHSWNESRAVYFMYQGIDVVIIDATNVRISAVTKYSELALIFGYDVKIEESNTPWANNPEECYKRNIHGCPLETIKNMKNYYKYMEEK